MAQKRADFINIAAEARNQIIRGGAKFGSQASSTCISKKYACFFGLPLGISV
jgi:hypothetical protein